MIFTKTTILLTLILILGCRIDRVTIGGNEIDYPNSDTWMANIDDEKELQTLTIPGTHDTCANYDFLGLSSTAAAQDLTLTEQLNAGIRAIDIRPYHEKDDSFTIHHGPAFQHMTYKDVVQICYEFLTQHQSETIIFTVYNENRTTTEDKNIAQCIIDEIEQNPSFWLDVKENQGIGIKLKDARGKLVLLKRFNEAFDYGINRGNYIWIGGNSKTSDLNNQWNKILLCLDECSRNSPNKLKFINTSGYFEGQFGIPNIRIASSYINTVLLDYLKDKENSNICYGSIMCDHISKKLAYYIYRVNLL